MIRFWQKILLLCSFSGLMVSCSQEEMWHENLGGSGDISIKLSSSGSVSSALPTVRSVSTDLVTPPLEHFNIRLTSGEDGSVKTWTSLSDFEKESSFPVGTYKIEAFYGSEESQGMVAAEEEGHEHAYYYGVEENIEVKPGETTTVQLRAGLANAVVAVEYTESFKKYFPSWSTTLQTAGHSPISLGGTEGIAYIAPGNVNVIIRTLLQNGKSLTLNPASFEALPKYMYKIRYNLNNDNLGKAEVLEITFNDDPDETHIVKVELSEELINSDAPVITTQGFASGQTLESLENTPYNGDVKFTVNAPGGLTEAKLTISSNSKDLSLPFLTNGEVDLCHVSADQRAEIEKAGIHALGFFEKPDKMALLDLSEFCQSLPVGLTEISLVVKDKIMRSNEPATVKFSTVPMEMTSMGRVAWFADGYGEVVINYNGTDPTQPGKNPFTFSVMGDMNYVDADIISINDIPYTRSFDTAEYVYRIKLPAASRNEFPVKISYNGKERESLATAIPIRYPEYKLELDPLSSVIRMRIAEYTEKDGSVVDIRNNTELQNLLINRMRIFIDNEEISLSKIQNQGNGILTVSGYAAGSSHVVETTIEEGEDISYKTNDRITMETAAEVENGNFSQDDGSKAINFTKIDTGGTYRVAVLLADRTYQNFSSIQRSVPANWATVNDLTCYSGSNPQNTWFMAPSTFLDGNSCVIRTVGYHHSGTVPERSGGNGQFNTNYYCENSPSNLNIGVGELFLGSYSYTSSGANRVNGISFGSRPASLSFDYSYTSYNNEYGEAYIKVYSGEKVIGSGSLQLPAESNLKNCVINLADYAFGEKPTRIEIGFRSTGTGLDPQIRIPQGEALKEPSVTSSNFTSDNGRTIAANQYKAFAMGSELRISNVKLGY